MNFRPELAAKVMAGEKTVTRRLVSDNPRSPWSRERCTLQPGRTYAVCPGRGKHATGRVLVTDTRLEPIGSLNNAEALREGFADAAAFERAFVAINGGTYDPSALVWRVEGGDEPPAPFAFPGVSAEDALFDDAGEKQHRDDLRGYAVEVLHRSAEATATGGRTC